MTFSGRAQALRCGELSINFSTSTAGSVRVQDVVGESIQGYALADCNEIVGDSGRRVIRWKNGADIAALAGRPVWLRFVMKDADIYSVPFTNEIRNP